MAARRGHGEGSIYFDTSKGCYRAAVEIGRDVNGKRRRKRFSGKTIRDLRRRIKEFERQRDDGMAADGASITVAALFEHMFNTVLPARDLSPSTIDNYRWSADKILPALGHIRLRALTPEDIETLLGAHGHLSRSSLNRIRTVLGAALFEAERRAWVLRNVAKLAITPPSHTTQRRALDEDQARQLLSTASGHPLEAAILIGVTRGLRPGELLGLRWADLELNTDPPVMHIRQTLKHHKGRLSFGPPKTPQSIRSLVIPTTVLTTLRSHRARQASERLAAGEYWVDHDLLFCTEIGTPIDPSNFRRSFQTLTKAAGLGSWAPYELRHSAITLASGAGVALEDIADLAGHADTRMVMGTYRHQTRAVDAGASLNPLGDSKEIGR